MLQALRASLTHHLVEENQEVEALVLQGPIDLAHSHLFLGKHFGSE